MTNALFIYRRRVLVNGEERFNDNFINPLNVVSMFWETNQEGKPILNIFLNAVRSTQGGTNSYSITFGETLGMKFVNYMEEFLARMIGFGRATVVQSVQPKQERHSRKAVDAEVVVEEDPGGATTEWVNQ